MLTDDRDSNLRLKAFSASYKGGKHVIRIEVEATNSYSFADAIEGLEGVQKGQRTPAPKREETLARQTAGTVATAPRAARASG